MNLDFKRLCPVRRFFVRARLQKPRVNYIPLRKKLNAWKYSARRVGVDPTPSCIRNMQYAMKHVSNSWLTQPRENLWGGFCGTLATGFRGGREGGHPETPVISAGNMMSSQLIAVCFSVSYPLYPAKVGEIYHRWSYYWTVRDGHRSMFFCFLQLKYIWRCERVLKRGKENVEYYFCF